MWFSVYFSYGPYLWSFFSHLYQSRIFILNIVLLFCWFKEAVINKLFRYSEGGGGGKEEKKEGGEYGSSEGWETGRMKGGGSV